jgi:anti-anti-sigma factor
MRRTDDRLTGAAQINQSPWTSIIVSGPPTRRDAVRRLLRPYGPTLTAELRHRVHALLRCGEREIVVDVGRLSSIDAAGVGQLVRAYNVTRALKGGLRVANATARVREVLERVGLFDVLRAGE